MIFYRLHIVKELYSFNDAIGSIPINGSTLDQIQEKYIQELGGELIDIKSEKEITSKGAYFIFRNDLYFSIQFLRKCVDKSAKSNKNIQFGVSQNRFNERFILPTKLDSDDIHLFDFKFKHTTENQSFETELIEQEEFEHLTKMPSQIVTGSDYFTNQCDTFASHITSPFHLLMVNLAENLSRTVNFQNKVPAFLRKKFGKNGTKWFYKGLKRLNKIGKNCKIHPTAIIEGSVIGDNCTIGANAIVRLSNLEEDCYVSDNVVIINSVLSKKTFIANSNYINSCFTYPEVFLIHGPYQLSIFGENAACFAVINCDIRLDQLNIKIPTNEGVIDSNQPLLGIAYGHRSKTGGGNIIASGRIVPNDLHINPPDNIILKFES
jgi:hypothetical protein